MQVENVLAPPPVGRDAVPGKAIQSIADRERLADRYWTHSDKLNSMRIWWRATTARHLLHLLPGETILELGCGSGTLTSRDRRCDSGRMPGDGGDF